MKENAFALVIHWVLQVVEVVSGDSNVAHDENLKPFVFPSRQINAEAMQNCSLLRLMILVYSAFFDYIRVFPVYSKGQLKK